MARGLRWKGAGKGQKRSLARPGKPKGHIQLLSYLPKADWVLEYRFCPSRRWRFDAALPQLQIAVEQEGGLWIQGRHNRAPGMINDMEKYNFSAMLGWRVLRYTPQQIKAGLAYRDCEQLLKSSGD